MRGGHRDYGDRMRYRFTTPALNASRAARRREARKLKRKFERYPKYVTKPRKPKNGQQWVTLRPHT